MAVGSVKRRHHGLSSVHKGLLLSDSRDSVSHSGRGILLRLRNRGSSPYNAGLGLLLCMLNLGRGSLLLRDALCAHHHVGVGLLARHLHPVLGLHCLQSLQLSLRDAVHLRRWSEIAAHLRLNADTVHAVGRGLHRQTSATLCRSRSRSRSNSKWIRSSGLVDHPVDAVGSSRRKMSGSLSAWYGHSGRSQLSGLGLGSGLESGLDVSC